MAEELKRHGLTFSLDLNKHPKDAINLSLVDAKNIRISNDKSTICTDVGNINIDLISNKLKEYFYKDNTLINYKYEIVHIIECNDELVLFVASNYFINNNNEIIFKYEEDSISPYYKHLNIFRYNEKLNICSDAIIPNEILNFTFDFIKGSDIEHVTSKFPINSIKYYGGKFSSTFTYNVKNELIITFCEYDSVFPTEFECGEPMKTINLGYWENNIVEEGIDNWILINNSNLDPRTFAICPEVTIPKITEWSIEQGVSKKGWYHFYIRYKINDYDYTQWFDFGRAFYLDESKEQVIFKYPVNDKTTGVGETYEDGDWKISSIISDDTDICNKTIKFKLLELNDIYNFYQIGFICNTKIYSECKITDDIDISNNTFQLNYKNCNDYDINQIIKTYNNYYNVKNIINYNNRLYISNFKTKSILSNISQNINFKIIQNQSNTSNNIIKIKLGNEIKTLTLTNNKIKAKDIYGVEKLYSYKTKVKDSEINKGITASNDESVFLNMISRIISTNTFDDYQSNSIIKNLTSIYLLRANGKSHNFPEEKNSTMLNGKARQMIKNNWCKRIYFYFDRYENITDISEYEFEYNKTNNTLNCTQLTEDINVIGVSKEIYLGEDNYSDYIEYPTILKTFTPIVDIDKSEDLNNSFTLIPRQPYCFYIHYVDKYGNVTDGLPIRNMMYETISYYDGPGYYIHNNKEKYVTIGSICDNNHGEYYKYFVYIMAKLNEPLPIFDGVNFKNHKLNLNKLLFNVTYLNGETTNNIYEYNNLKNISTIANDAGEIKTFKYLFEDSENDGFYVNKGSLFYLYSDTKYSHLPTYQIMLLNSFVNKNYNYGYLSDNSFWILNNYKNKTSIEFNNITIPKNYVSYFISYEKLDKIQLFEGIIKDSRFYSDTLNYKDKLEIGVNIDSNDNIISKVDYKVANSFKDDNFGKSSNLNITYEKEDAVAGNYLYKYPINIYNNSNKNLLRITEISKESLISTNTYGFYSQYGSVITKKPFRINSANKLINSDNVELLTANPLYTDTTSTKLFTYIPDSSKQINNSPKIYKTNISDVNFDNPKADFYDSYLFLPQDTIDLFKNNALDYDESVLSIYVNYNENNINQTDFVKTIRRSTYIKDESLENGWRIFESEAYQNIKENKGEIIRIEGVGDLLLVHTEDSLFQFDKSNLLITANKNVQLAQGDTFDVGYKEIFTSKNGFGGLQDKDAAIVGEFGYIWYNNDFNKIYQYDAGSLNIISGSIANFLNKFKPTKCIFTDDKINRRIFIKFTYNFYGEQKESYLSYNYDTKTFIGFHKLSYINSYNTKNKTYLLNKYSAGLNILLDSEVKYKFNLIGAIPYKDLNLQNDSLIINSDILSDENVFDWEIIKNGEVEFKSVNENILIDNKIEFESSIKIIINENYTKLKRLNNIKYKLYKKVISDNIKYEYIDEYSTIDTNIRNKIPYSGYKLRVYNDLCDTGYLDITQDLKGDGIINNNENKPYYDLGNFTFNYLRDKDTNSQIFGNFFIVEFIFEHDKDNVIEFESLEYNVNYEEN